MHIAIWILALIALALWSAAAWGLGTVLGLDPSWVGDLKPLLQQIPYAALIDQWVPGWQDLLVALLDLTRSLLAWAGGAGVVVVWVLWALGAAVIVVAAALLSLVVALVRKSGAKGPPPSAAAA